MDFYGIQRAPGSLLHITIILLQSTRVNPLVRDAVVTAEVTDEHDSMQMLGFEDAFYLNYSDYTSCGNEWMPLISIYYFNHRENEK